MLAEDLCDVKYSFVVGVGIHLANILDEIPVGSFMNQFEHEVVES